MLWYAMFIQICSPKYGIPSKVPWIIPMEHISGFGAEHCRHLHVFCKLSISFSLNFCVQLSCKFSSLATSSDLMIFFPAHLKSFKQLWHCPFAWSAQRRRNDFYYQAPKQPISSICEAIWYISPRNLTMFLARCEGFYKWGVPLNHPF